MKKQLLAILAIPAFISFSLPSISADVTSNYASLEHKFEVGEILRYRIAESLSGKHTLGGDSSGAPISAEMVTIVKIRCIQKIQNSVELGVELESSQLEYAGNTRNMPIPKGEHKIRLQSNGEPVEFKDEDEELKSSSPFVIAGRSADMLLFSLILPESPVRIGANWNNITKSALNRDTKFDMSFRVEGFQQQGEDRLVRISQTIKTEPLEQSVLNLNKNEVQAQILFSIDKGRLISSKGSINTKIHTPSNMPGNQETESVAAMTISNDFNVELIEEKKL